jgi:hypothetical protein
VDRSERLIKLGDSWFSPKHIEVWGQLICAGGRALNELGGPQSYRTQSNSEYPRQQTGTQALRAKFQRREGKNPDRQLRSPIHH